MRGKRWLKRVMMILARLCRNLWRVSVVKERYWWCKGIPGACASEGQWVMGMERARADLGH